ncbi:hypothetical protein TNCV_4937811 [Trichonephila clavipes]|nr:hypothetical protein TNCV_4937811 [Trichonephila clavipes]
MIVSKTFGSQHSLNHHVAHICGGGYSPRDRLRLLLEFMQHMLLLFKFRCPCTPRTPCVMHLTDKQTGFSEIEIQAFESFFLIRQASGRKSFPVQFPGLEGTPIHNAVKEMDMVPFWSSLQPPKMKAP